MAKGQNRGNREAKKPKATKKPTVAAGASQYQTPVKIATPKNAGK